MRLIAYNSNSLSDIFSNGLFWITFASPLVQQSGEGSDGGEGVEGGGGGNLSWRLLRRGGEASSSGLSPHQGTRIIFPSLVTKEYPSDTHLTKEHIATFLSLAHIESFNLRHSHILWQNICSSKSKAEVCWDNYGGIDTLQQQDCIDRISEDLVLMLTL